MKSKKEFKALLEKAERREKRARRNAIIYSIIPILLAGGLIAITYYQVTMYRNEIEDYKVQIKDLKEQLAKAIDFERNVYELRWEIKSLYSRYPRQSRVLDSILTEQRNGVSWKLGGNSPQEGFDSPSFAAYILAKHQLLDTRQPGFDRYALPRYLPKKNRPDVGDIIFYDTGYAMFYFNDRGREFVVGMTPLGIISLEKNFGPRIIGIGDVRY